MRLNPAAIRVVKPFVGGGFGHRTECLNFEIIAALLARAARGAVRIALSREQTFVMPQTDERGISQVDLSFQDQTRGANVDLELWAVWRGELQAVTRDSFRIWW